MTHKEKETPIELDEVDLKILRILQEDSRISNTKLAQAVNLSETPCWRRWKRLEENGLISRYRAVLDRRKLGFGVVAFVNVTFQTHNMDPTMEFEKNAGIGLDRYVSLHHGECGLFSANGCVRP